MSKNDKRLHDIYIAAYNFLREKVGEKALKAELNYYEKYSRNSLSLKDVFHHMLDSLKNKQGYVNYIVDTDKMSGTLFKFDARKVYEFYGDDWKKLFIKFRNRKFRNYSGKLYRMKINDNRNAWVMYCKGVLSCAKFLASFKNINDFDKFVKSFFHNEFTIASLPMLLEKEIFGYGFPLACDFLKELGYWQYGKPDVHLKDIFQRLDLVNDDSDYEVFKIIVKIGIIVKRKTAVIDKIFWIIGSGNLSQSDKKIGRQKNNFYKYLKENKII